jgi:hypothetical protein
VGNGSSYLNFAQSATVEMGRFQLPAPGWSIIIALDIKDRQTALESRCEQELAVRIEKSKVRD